MFKKLARIPDQKERLEVYNILKMNISFSLYLADFFSISILISGLGWLLSREVSLIIKDFAGSYWLASSVSVIFILAFAVLVRLVPQCAYSQMQSAFNLDERPFATRFRQIVKADLKLMLIAWLVCMLFFALLVKLQLFIWTIVATAIVCCLVAVASYWLPVFLRAGGLRKLEKGELASQISDQIERWSNKSGLHADDIVVSTEYKDCLSAPYLAGISGKTKMLIDERALKEFSAQQLLLLFSSCVMASLIKAPVKITLIRMCTAAVAVPVASLLISSVGVSFWGYPMVYSPALVSLFLLSAWLGNIVMRFAVNLVKRSLEVQLGVAACLLLKDEKILFSAMELMAEKNLNEKRPLGWRNLFMSGYSFEDYIKRVKYQQHLAKFEQQ